MNKFYHAVILMLVLSVFSCKIDKPKNDFDSLIDFKGKTHLKFIVNNCSDTTVLWLRSQTLIPFNMEIKQLMIPNDGIYNVAFNSSHPFLGQLIIGSNRFPIFTIPDDTLKVYVSLDLNNDHQNSIKYEGETKHINDYYITKFKRFNYPEIAIPATNYTSPSYSIYEGADKIDSLFNDELKFLSKYDHRADLPAWFIKMEKGDLMYYNASFKISAIFSRNYFYSENTKANDSYFNFLDSVPVINPEAYSSYLYFTFLDSYFLQKRLDDYEKISKENTPGFEMAFAHHKSYMPDVIKELSGDFRKFYLAYSFSRLYRNVEKNSQISKLDSLFATVYSYIDDSALVNLVKNFHYISNTELINNVRNNGNIETEKGEKITFLNKGEMAPDFYLSDVNGNFHSLKDFKGQLVYLSFWATWCTPCIKNIPAKNALIKEYEDKPIVFINISFDKENDTWIESIEKYKVSGLNLICKGNWDNILRTKYYIQGIPRYTLINKNGEVIESNAPSPGNKTELTSLIDNYLE